MSPPPFSEHLAPVLLTAADILRLKEDYESDVRLYEQLPARIKLKKRRFEAALLFAPAGFDPDAVSTEAAAAPVNSPSLVVQEATTYVAPASTASDHVAEPAAEPEAEDFQLTHGSVDSGERVTWIGELERILGESDRGLSHKEALAMLKETALGAKVSEGEKGFYNAVARLEKRGTLVKNGGRIYSKGLVMAMEARGEPLPDVTIETRRREGGTASVIIEILKLHPSGLDANQLRASAATMPGVPSSMSKHSHYIYNVLGTLMGQGIVVKGDDGLYRLKNASEA